LIEWDGIRKGQLTNSVLKIVIGTGIHKGLHQIVPCFVQFPTDLDEVRYRDEHTYSFPCEFREFDLKSVIFREGDKQQFSPYVPKFCHIWVKISKRDQHVMQLEFFGLRDMWLR